MGLLKTQVNYYDPHKGGLTSSDSVLAPDIFPTVFPLQPPSTQSRILPVPWLLCIEVTHLDKAVGWHRLGWAHCPWRTGVSSECWCRSPGCLATWQSWHLAVMAPSGGWRLMMMLLPENRSYRLGVREGRSYNPPVPEVSPSSTKRVYKATGPYTMMPKGPAWNWESSACTGHWGSDRQLRETPQCHGQAGLTR